MKSSLDNPQIGLWSLKAVRQGACHVWYRLSVPLGPRPSAPPAYWMSLANGEDHFPVS